MVSCPRLHPSASEEGDGRMTCLREKLLQHPVLSRITTIIQLIDFVVEERLTRLVSL